MITLDKSWFYLSIDYEQIWLRAKEQPPERLGHIIQDPKMMVTTAWNPLGFHLLDALPQGTCLILTTAALMFSQNFFRSDHRLMAGNSLFMLAPENPTTPEKAELFAKKIGSLSPYTHHIHMISHHQLLSLRTYQTLSAGNRFSIA
jgi:hypothetical protein